jgi:hypothetical protein
MIGKADLVEDLQNSRVERVPTKLAVEILTCLEKCDGNPLACEQQRQDHSARPASNQAASGLLDVRYIINGGLAGCLLRSLHRKNPLTLGNRSLLAFPKRLARAGALPALRAPLQN